MAENPWIVQTTTKPASDSPPVQINLNTTAPTFVAPKVTQGTAEA